MTTAKLKVGMVGVWNYGRHRRALMRGTGWFDLCALCDCREDWLNEARAEEGAGASVYGDFGRMLCHPGLEAVVISTGADTHAAFAIAAMQAGLHVFVEKPLCSSAAECDALRKVQQECNRVVGVGHNHCGTDGLLNLAREYCESGKLGTLVAYEENTSHSGGLEIKAGDWRGLADRNPGGMLFHCGVHSLHALNFLFGPIVAVQAMMRHDANPVTQTADAANVLLRHRSGLIGTLNCYHVTAYCHELRIFGTAGNLYMDTNRNEAWFQQRKCNQMESREPLVVPANAHRHDVASLEEWYQAIRGGGRNTPDLADGMRAVLPVFAAERAALEKQEIQVG